MITYSIEYSHIGPTSGEMYFNVFKSENNRKYQIFQGYNYGSLSAKHARELVEKLIVGEKSYVVLPKEVKKIEYK